MRLLPADQRSRSRMLPGQMTAARLVALVRDFVVKLTFLGRREIGLVAALIRAEKIIEALAGSRRLAMLLAPIRLGLGWIEYVTERHTHRSARHRTDDRTHRRANRSAKRARRRAACSRCFCHDETASRHH